MDGEASNSQGNNSRGPELIWCLFSAAANSYKCSSLVRPFPSTFLTDQGEKDIASMRDVAASVTNISDYLSKKARHLDVKQLTLLHWVLDNQNFSLEFCSIDRLEVLRTKTEENISVADPTFLFEVMHSEANDRKFKSLQGNRPIVMAYHGSRLENFHSILKHGLQGHLNRTSVYGEGTYLSSEPTVALSYSPWCSGLVSNSFGDSLSVVALCEIIQDRSVKTGSSNAAVDSNMGRRAPNSQGGNVPEVYFVVTNNDMVRIKYLLVYARKDHHVISERNSSDQTHHSRFGEWCKRNKGLLLLMFYLLVLIFIGLVNSKSFWNRMQQLYEETFESWDWMSPEV